MSLKDVLYEDLKRAMKEQNKKMVSVIRLARAAILNAEKEKLHLLDDQEVIEVLAKEVKQRRDAILEYKKANRQDTVAELESEIDILMGYMPKQLSEDEITELVSQTVFEVGAQNMNDMGRVMKALMPKVKGRADGQLVNKIVRQQLQ
jgi:uncharacterized protein YqeY